MNGLNLTAPGAAAGVHCIVYEKLVGSERAAGEAVLWQVCEGRSGSGSSSSGSSRCRSRGDRYYYYHNG